MQLNVFFCQELISSPPGSKNSQSDSQSENSQEKPGQFIFVLATQIRITPDYEFLKKKNFLNSDTLNDPNSESQHESQVLNICPALNKKYVWTKWRRSVVIVF